MPTKKKRILITLDPETERELSRRSKLEKRPVATIVVELLRFILKYEVDLAKREGRKDWWRNLAKDKKLRSNKAI